MPDAGFTRACTEATGGNPLFVREVAAALIADEIEPTADATAHVLAAGPQAIARVTLARLGRLSADAVELARAIAVLGGDASLPRAASLAGLDEGQALAALDALVAADVVPASQASIFATRSSAPRSMTSWRPARAQRRTGARRHCSERRVRTSTRSRGSLCAVSRPGRWR